MRNTHRLLAVLLVAGAAAAPVAAQAQAQSRIITGRGSATLSNAVRVGDLVFASGALPSGADSTIEGQTTSTLENIKRTLETAGTSINNAVKCTVFLVEGADFRGMNSAYTKFWSAENPPPARTTVVVKALVVPSAKLEIECVAAMPKP